MIRVATRPSPLAIRQSELAIEAMKRAHPDVAYEIVRIKSEADVRQDVPLSALGDKGVFVARVERALLNGDADVAVHSLKDVPGVEPAGLQIAACLRREDPRDVLVSRNGEEFHLLPSGSAIGTSSLRRTLQLRAIRPDLRFLPIRGNVGTRLGKLDKGEFDAIVLATAGMYRLGVEEKITEYLSPEICTPAPGQGIIALQCRIGSATCAMLEDVGDLDAASEGRIERAIAAQMGADCTSAFGALATVRPDQITIRVALGMEDGTVWRAVKEGDITDAHGLVEAVCRDRPDSA